MRERAFVEGKIARHRANDLAFTKHILAHPPRRIHALFGVTRCLGAHRLQRWWTGAMSVAPTPLALEADECEGEGPVPGADACCYRCFSCCCCPPMCALLYTAYNICCFTLKWSKPTAADAADDAFTEHALLLSKGTARFAGPEPNCTMIIGNALVRRALARFAEREAAGEVDRSPGYLGVTQYGRVWPENPWKSIALGADKAHHDQMRPLVAKLMGSAQLSGAWSAESLRASADAFFEKRTSVDLDVDLQVWVQQVLHRVNLGIELSEAEAKQVFGLFNPMAVNACLPVRGSAVASNPMAVHACLPVRDTPLRWHRNPDSPWPHRCYTCSPA